MEPAIQTLWISAKNIIFLLPGASFPVFNLLHQQIQPIISYNDHRTLVHYSKVWPEGGVSIPVLCKLWLVISFLWLITTYLTHLGKIPAFTKPTPHLSHWSPRLQWRAAATAYLTLTVSLKHWVRHQGMWEEYWASCSTQGICCYCYCACPRMCCPLSPLLSVSCQKPPCQCHQLAYMLTPFNVALNSI